MLSEASRVTLTALSPHALRNTAPWPPLPIGRVPLGPSSRSSIQLACKDIMAARACMCRTCHAGLGNSAAGCERHSWQQVPASCSVWIVRPRTMQPCASMLQLCKCMPACQTSTDLLEDVVDASQRQDGVLPCRYRWYIGERAGHARNLQGVLRLQHGEEVCQQRNGGLNGQEAAGTWLMSHEHTTGAMQL